MFPGTKLRSRYLHTSTGCEALDSLLGSDGLPFGAIVLIDEPGGGINSPYSNALLRYFLAEGVLHKHTIFLADNDKSLLENVPELAEVKPDTTQAIPRGSEPLRSRDEEPEDMKIAWRYSTVPKMDSTIGRNRSKFDLAKNLSKERLEQCDIRRLEDPSTYQSLWSKLHNLIKNGQFSKEPSPAESAESSQPKKFLRVLLPNLNQAYWGSHKMLKRFIAHLQVFSRDANAVFMITVDSNLMEKEEFNELLPYVDTVFRLERMSEEERDQFKPDNIHGRFVILRLPMMTSIAPHKPDVLDLTFYLDRHSFYIKILHLPPAVGPETTSNQPKLSCQSFKNEF